MATAKKKRATRSSTASRAAASSRVNDAGEREPAPPTEAATAKGPRRRQLPDGKGPNDPVLFADLIALGYVDAADIQVAGESDDA